MCVGNAYTLCDSIALLDVDTEDEHNGPFSELFMEVGIQNNEGARLRLKLDYSVKDDERVLGDTPTLHLRNMYVCRERVGDFPASDENIFFGSPGAPGGIYDYPPVGSEEQQFQYMCMELEGGASTLFPYAIEQNNEFFNGFGWVVTLDWTPGQMRYQVDRKFHGGIRLKGLKTLELCEVQGDDADKWRPNSGPQDMRQ